MIFRLRSFALLSLFAGALVSVGPVRSADRDPPVRIRVLQLVFDPIIESEGGRRLHEVCGYRDPLENSRQCVADLKECSGGYIDCRIAETRMLDQFPLKKDGFRYTDESFLRCFRTKQGWHAADALDYDALRKEFDLDRLIDRRRFDEVWVQAMPYAGLYESVMVGKNAYFCNAPPITESTTRRNYVIMGYNYERGVGEMLEDFGHRTESILRKVYGSWEPRDTHAWNRFTLYDKVAPGKAAAGNVHFAPNSERDYDWGNRRPVLSTADDWLNYPHLTGTARTMTSADWGGGDIRLHHKWWLTRLPKAPGKGPDGAQANWWKYVFRFNDYAESR